jgi:hypothetical protein
MTVPQTRIVLPNVVRPGRRQCRSRTRRPGCRQEPDPDRRGQSSDLPLTATDSPPPRAKRVWFGKKRFLGRSSLLCRKFPSRGGWLPPRDEPTGSRSGCSFEYPDGRPPGAHAVRQARRGGATPGSWPATGTTSSSPPSTAPRSSSRSRQRFFCQDEGAARCYLSVTTGTPGPWVPIAQHCRKRKTDSPLLPPLLHPRHS